MTYSFETKKKTIEMRLQGMTIARIAEELGIIDTGRLKVCIRRYNQINRSVWGD